MASQPEEDPGFEALLKPIQDLTRNWEVDLCLHLEEYISYIRQICGENIPEMNFAQAAVLVQNSANIYSKKVDFLFTTVLQLLDTLSKKQTEAKNRASQDEVGNGEAGPSTGRRRRVATIDLDDFSPVDNIAAERPPRLDWEKEKKKLEERKKRPQIVLNAATKVKAKENTSCNIYDHTGNVMGKKEEFRLNWRMSSDGTLHEEFLINKNRFQSMEPIEVTVYETKNLPLDDDESHHDYDDPNLVDSNAKDPPPDDDQAPPLFTSIISNGPVDRESEEVRGLGEARLRKEELKIVDINKIAWDPNDFNHNITEKPKKKKNLVKLPQGLDDEKKRKSNKGDNVIEFTITDVLFQRFKNNGCSRDLDFGYQSKENQKNKRQLLQYHRKAYFDYVEKLAGVDDGNDFHGFVDEEDDDFNDFGGFGDDDEGDDDIAPEIDVPLPENASIIIPANEAQGWKGDNDTYDNEAKKTLAAFRTRKIDHGRMTDLAKRVEEWHAKILPQLEDAEKRSSFDINEYGSKVLSSFTKGIGSKKLFSEVVAGQPKEEVSRYFLAVLLLANQYNLRITKTDETELARDCVQLELLSTARHHEKMDDKLRETADKEH